MALPNLSHVALVPTGEFYALTHQEAHEANRRGGAWGGPIKAEQGRDDPEATFRIRFEKPLESGSYKYTYYNAEELWKWAKATNSNVDPLGNPWFYEDWMALHAKYAQGDPVPHWVFSMRCSEEGHVLPGVPSTHHPGDPPRQGMLGPINEGGIRSVYKGGRWFVYDDRLRNKDGTSRLVNVFMAVERA